MNLQKMRIAKGLSQSQLANISNINVRTLQAYEQGQRNIEEAKLNTLLDMAIALNCRVSDLLDDEVIIDKCNRCDL